MSGPPSLAIAQIFYAELFYQTKTFQAPWASNALYLIGAIVGGGCMEFSDDRFDYDPDDVAGSYARDHGLLALIEDFKCLPLLQPYMTAKTYTEEDITVLRVVTKLKDD